MTKITALEQPRSGYTFDDGVKPANKVQLLALRDLMLSIGNKEVAAAVDNVIDIMTQRAKVLRGLLTQDTTPNPPLRLVTHTQRVKMLVESGAVNADGSLKPYRATGHASPPLTPEELGEYEYPY